MSVRWGDWGRGDVDGNERAGLSHDAGRWAFPFLPVLCSSHWHLFSTMTTQEMLAAATWTSALSILTCSRKVRLLIELDFAATHGSSV